MKRKIQLDDRQAALLASCVDRQIAEDLKMKALFEKEQENAMSAQYMDEAALARDHFIHRIRRLQELRELIG